MPGVIAAGSQETVNAGAAILRQGGNAVDAAVAAAFASFIAEIGVVHLGGSGIAQLYDPRQGKGVVYDFFSDTPGLGFEPGPIPLDFGQVTVDFGVTTQDFHLGRGSVAVPGNIKGLCQMAADYGRLPLANLLAPAIRLAQEGTAIEPFQADTCALLAPLYTHTESMRAVFRKNEHIIRPGERLFIPNLAETLKEIARHGADFAYSGTLAKALVADQAEHGGMLTASDLAAYAVPRLEPIRLRYRAFEILLPPPSSTGGVLTAFSLRLLSSFPLRELPHASADHLRLLAEVMGATTRARTAWESWRVALPAADAIDRFMAPAFVGRYVEEVRSAVAERRPFETLREAPGPANTSHLSVIDGQGLAVSLTTTAGESAGYIVPGTGYIPNNIMGEEDLHPAGFHSQPPGVRIPTMMTPVVVLRDGKIRLVVGSGGSTRIRSAVLQVLSNLLDFGMSLDDAVNTARVHYEGGILQCEHGYSERSATELEEMGYVVNRWPARSIYFGGAHSVSRTQDGRLVAAGDSRRGGAVAHA
jgi:gamma-glutamyltranspeptidase/glutathione hydrolase